MTIVDSIIDLPRLRSSATPRLLPGPTVTGEPKIHGIVGTYYGDLEVDVGKAVRWLDYYTDDLYIQDTNTGEQRYWVINWSASFPQSKHGVTGRNYFLDNANWRRDQFNAADKAWKYSPEDWCIFLDGSEGLSFDNRTLPDDYDAAPFMSWLYREMDRATGDSIVLPVFVYLHNSDLQTVTYQPWAGDLSAGAPPPQQAVSVPWYLPYKGLRRMFKVSALRDVAFDWTQLDKYVDPPDAGVKAQIVSYSYTHWRPEDIPPGETTVPPLSKANDDGWRMRNLMSLLRPIPSLPIGQVNGPTWDDGSGDPVGVPGPWCVDTMTHMKPDLPSTIEEQGHTPTDPVTAGVLTPLYDTVIRLNLRDGLWYERGTSGNIPLAWDDVNQVWVPLYSPEEWQRLGVGSTEEPPPALSVTSLALDGASGTYSWIEDANYLDFKEDGFTLAAVVQLVTYMGAEDQVLISKWVDGGQAAWCWGVGMDGSLYLDISYDGTNTVYTAVSTVIPDLTDGTPYGLAVSFVLNTISNQDEIRFWLYDPDEVSWNLVGAVVVQDNDTAQVIPNTTSIVSIAACNDGTEGNAAGLFRWASVRSGVGQGNILAGNEVARMRGDLTTNPTYDRYGNLWVNEGGWSYAEMINPPV